MISKLDSIKVYYIGIPIRNERITKSVLLTIHKLLIDDIRTIIMRLML